MKWFKRALQEVPKSGEVWCEGARIAMMKRKWKQAEKYLKFAIHFTPQYGDSFIELIRLDLLRGHCDDNFEQLVQTCINSEPNYGTMWNYCKRPLWSIQKTLMFSKDRLQEGDSMLSSDWKKQNNVSFLQLSEKWHFIVGEKN